MLAETDVKILQNEKSNFPLTVFMDGLNFLNSHWQLLGVNINLLTCHAASLTLELNYSVNVTVDNCTFGNWTFRQVNHVLIKNSRNAISQDFPTSLIFDSSSGLMENITIKDLNFTKMSYGLKILDNSYIQIRNSNFISNTVTHGIIKVLNSSTMEMSDCNMEKNKAINYAGAIFIDKSSVYLINSSFNDNEAVQGGGALHVKESSFLYTQNCSFSNNQVKIGHGGAIYLSNSTAQGITINFTDNGAKYGGGLTCFSSSKIAVQHTHFSHNTAFLGGAIFGSTCNRHALTVHCIKIKMSF